MLTRLALRSIFPLLVTTWGHAQVPLPVDLAPITEGIRRDVPIGSEEMRGRFEVLVEAINALHARVDVLERQTLTQGTYNLAFHYDVGTGRFSIRCLDERSQAVACSAENPGYVVMPSVRHGGLVRLVVDTDEHYFHDERAAAANQDLAGNSFNSERGRPWPERRPFFVYAVNRDDTNEGLRFGLTLHPAATRVPQFGAEGGRHVVGARRAPADANEAVDFVFLWGNGVNDRASLERDYKTVPKPVQRIGSLELSKLVVGGVDQWRVERWGPDQDENGMSVGEWRVGLGRYPWGVSYALPLGGATGSEIGTHFQNEVGQVACAQSDLRYRFSADGLVRLMTNIIRCTTQNQVADTGVRLSLPYKGASVYAANESQPRYLGSVLVLASNALGDTLVSLYLNDGYLQLYPWYENEANLAATDALEFFGAGANSMTFETTYRAFLD